MKALVLLLASGTCLAGEFINLTFDAPDLSGPLEPVFPGGPFRGATAELLRGWSVTLSGSPADQMVYSPPLNSWIPPVTLFGNTPVNASTALGAYSLSLESPRPEFPEIRISQRGTIPADAVGLGIASAGYIQAFVNGSKVGEVNPLLGSQALLNVSPFAGHEVDLEFFLRAGDSARFDVLGFTTVPEPSTWALLGLGTAGLVWRCRRHRN